MTLHELIIATHLNGKVPIPCSIKDLEVKNSEDFCRYAELQYIKSIDFIYDLIDILNYLVETSVSLECTSLVFIKDNSNKLKLKLSYDNMS